MKKRDWKSHFITAAGIIFLFFGIGAWINSIVMNDVGKLIWMCYLSLIIMGVGVLRRDSFMMMSQVYILSLPIVVWDADFLFHLFTGHTLFGITDYFFVESFNFGKFISLQHLFVVPLAIYIVFLLGLKRKDAWKVSLIQITVIYFVTLFFTPASENLNCVFSSCMPIEFGAIYPLVWFTVFFGMTLISAFILNKFIKK